MAADREGHAVNKAISPTLRRCADLLESIVQQIPPGVGCAVG